MRRLSPKGGWTWGGVPARTLGPKGGGLGVPHRLEKGMSANENAGPGGGWIVRSHIGWGRKRNIFISVCKSFPGIHVLKTLRKSPKRTISPSGELGPLQKLYKFKLDTVQRGQNYTTVEASGFGIHCFNMIMRTASLLKVNLLIYGLYRFLHCSKVLLANGCGTTLGWLQNPDSLLLFDIMYECCVIYGHWIRCRNDMYSLHRNAEMGLNLKGPSIL